MTEKEREGERERQRERKFVCVHWHSDRMKQGKEQSGRVCLLVELYIMCFISFSTQCIGFN